MSVSANTAGPRGAKLRGLREENHTLYSVIKLVSSSLEMLPMLHGVVDLATEATGCHACFIYLLEDGQLTMRAASPVFAYAVGNVQIGLDEGTHRMGGAPPQSGVHPRRGHERPADEIHPALQEERFQSMVAVPILSRSEDTIGVIVLHTQALHEFTEHVGIPILAAIPQAVESLIDLGMHREVQLIVSGGIRTGADVAKALALGADAVSIGVAALIALGDNAPEHDEGYRALGSAAGYYDDYQAGLDPAGISTQDPDLADRLDPLEGGRRLANYLRTLTLETQTLARACGKSHVLNLEPEDLVALTIEAAAMARVPLAGTSWIPGTITTP